MCTHSRPQAEKLQVCSQFCNQFRKGSAGILRGFCTKRICKLRKDFDVSCRANCRVWKLICRGCANYANSANNSDAVRLTQWLLFFFVHSPSSWIRPDSVLCCGNQCLSLGQVTPSGFEMQHCSRIRQVLRLRPHDPHPSSLVWCH